MNSPLIVAHVLRLGLTGILIASAPLAPPLRAEESSVPQPTLQSEILPLLRSRCLKCHGPIKPKGGLDVSNGRSLGRGGETGLAVEPGSLEESVLWEKIESDEMPPRPEEPLSAEEKQTVRRWIEQGAAGLPRPDELAGTLPNTDHWAFGPLTCPEPPAPRDPSRVRTTIDRFIQASLERQGLGIGPETDRATLIRRLSFDLTGLPPSPEDVTSFLEDPRPDARERLIERLLASPHYGERWGRYWLDAMGYAESNGYFSADSDRPWAWRYRDYVIRSFNRDRPLDQIVREQLAGDELAGTIPGDDAIPDALDPIIATHYLRNGQDGTGESDGNPDEVRADKVAVLDGAVQIIGSSLLGLTLQCAKCHDHKFEPVTQEEYYQLQSILYPAFPIENWVKPNDRFIDLDAAAPNEMLAWRAHETAINAEIERLRRELTPSPDLPDAERKAKQQALDKAVKEAESKRRPHPGRIAWVTDLSATPVNASILLRGNPSSPGPTVEPGVPAFLSDPENRYQVIQPSETDRPRTTGRRLALAHWLTRPGSRPAALLARVLANRIWQHHFGTALVATSENLGYSGALPTHPELLEFLSSELVNSGWSTKTLHRLILNSAVYGQSSTESQHARAIDPENHGLSRFPVQRLDAEAIRDAMLAVSGELDRRLGGPSVPTRRTETGEVVPADPNAGGLRRSIYLQHRRTQIESLLEVFDAPSIVTTCPRRQPATVPLQSLTLLNSDFVVSRAFALAERLLREAPPEDEPSSLIDLAFRRTLSRPPDPSEEAAASWFLKSQPACYPNLSPPDARRQATADFCQMLLAGNAFLYLD